MKRIYLFAVLVAVMFSVGCFDSATSTTTTAGSTSGKRVKSVTATKVTASIVNASEINASVMGDMYDVQRSIVIVPGVKYDVTEYNANGNANRVDYTESGDARHIVFTYTSDNKLATKTRYTGTTWIETKTYTYTSFGKVSTIIWENTGEATRTYTYAYDTSNALTKIECTKVGQGIIQERTVVGNVHTCRERSSDTLAWGAATVLTYTFNAAGKATKIEIGGQPTQNQYYTYDVDGRLTESTDGDGTKTYSYEMVEGEVTSWYVTFFTSLTDPIDLF